MASSPDEKVVREQEGVAVYIGDTTFPTHDGGTLFITTKGIRWKGKTTELEWKWSSIIEVPSKSWLRSDKVAVRRKQEIPFRLSFRKKGQPECFAAMENMLDESRRKHVGVGVAGLLRKMEMEAQHVGKELDTSFKDMNMLMEKAESLVSLAERFSKSLGKEEESEFRSYLLSMGIANPVTKESAGAGYHRELARELATALCPVVDKQGGMMGVVEVYCVVNRARGMELVSPKDMMIALELAEIMELGIQLVAFPSGARVVQTQQHKKEVSHRYILDLVRQRESVSVMEVAQEAGIAHALAFQKLQSAEGDGVLCRDVTITGIRFWENIF